MPQINDKGKFRQIKTNKETHPFRNKTKTKQGRGRVRTTRQLKGPQNEIKPLKAKQNKSRIHIFESRENIMQTQNMIKD